MPPAGPAYERPADERWCELQPYFTPAEPRRSGRRPLRRLLAPALAVLVVAGVGVGVTAALLAHGGGGSSAGSGAMSASESHKATDQAGGVAGSGAAAAPSGATPAAAAALPPATGYQVVAVARAGSYAGGTQTFSVVRALKGSPGATLAVTLAKADVIPAGDLRVLYLLPASPEPVPTASTLSGAPARNAFSYGGATALVVPLPAGETPSSISLP